jgi:hypothetical protein
MTIELVLAAVSFTAGAFMAGYGLQLLREARRLYGQAVAMRDDAIHSVTQQRIDGCERPQG